MSREARQVINLSFFFAGTGAEASIAGRGAQLSQWYHAVKAIEPLGPEDHRGETSPYVFNVSDSISLIEENIKEGKRNFKFPINGCGLTTEFGPKKGGLFGVGMRERSQDLVFLIREVESRLDSAYKYNINLIGFSRGAVTPLLALKALSVGSMVKCRINVFAVDPVPGVPRILINTGIALESWRVMRELLPFGRSVGGVRRAIYFHRPPMFHTALAVGGDWRSDVLPGGHAAAMRLIDPDSEDFLELLPPSIRFYHFVQEAGIPDVSFSEVLPGAEEEGYDQYFKNRYDGLVDRFTELWNKKEIQIHRSTIDRRLQDLAAPIFFPTRRGGGIELSGGSSSTHAAHLKYNNTHMPALQLGNQYALLHQLMARLPLQSVVRRPPARLTEKEEAYRALHNCIENNEAAVSKEEFIPGREAQDFRRFFGLLLIICVQSRKKEGKTFNGTILFAAISRLCQSNVRAEGQANQMMLKYLLGSYSKRFLTYQMMVRYAGNSLVLLDKHLLPDNPRSDSFQNLFSPENRGRNLAIVQTELAACQL
jgi:hypothetical protein